MTSSDFRPAGLEQIGRSVINILWRFSVRWVCWCILGTATWAAAADRPVIFPEPQEVTRRQDDFPVDEQVPVLVPESAKANDVTLARQLIAELSDRYGVSLRMASVPALPRGRFILMGSASN